MTIAIGVLCSDGIVLGADSQESLNQYSKVYRPKVFPLSMSTAKVRAVVAGAGDSVFIDSLKDKLELALNLAEPTSDALRSLAEDAIVGYCSRIWPLYATQHDRPTAELLIGIRASDGLSLLHADGPLVRRVEQFESIGFGADFSTYHLSKFLNADATVDWVCPLVIHILDLVKSNVEFCGGQSHVWVIHKYPGLELEQKDPDYINNTVSEFRNISTLTDRLVGKTPSLKYGESVLLEKLVEQYESDAVLREASEAMIKDLPGGIDIHAAVAKVKAAKEELIKALRLVKKQTERWPEVDKQPKRTGQKAAKKR